jgi:hypothetical protein
LVLGILGRGLASSRVWGEGKEGGVRPYSSRVGLWFLRDIGSWGQVDCVDRSEVCWAMRCT